MTIQTLEKIEISKVSKQDLDKAIDILSSIKLSEEERNNLLHNNSENAEATGSKE